MCTKCALSVPPAISIISYWPGNRAGLFLQRHFAAGKVRMGLVEIKANISLPLALQLTSLTGWLPRNWHCVCYLTSCFDNIGMWGIFRSKIPFSVPNGLRWSHHSINCRLFRPSVYQTTYFNCSGTLQCPDFAFTAPTLLAGCQRWHLACK